MLVTRVFMPSLSAGHTFLLNPYNRGFLTGERRRFEEGRVSRRGAWVIAFVAICLVPVGLVVTDIRTQSELAEAGLVTGATVTHHRLMTLANRGGRSTTYYLTLQYRAAEGATAPGPHTAEAEVSGATFRKNADGSTVLVRYLPRDPDTVRVVDASEGDARYKLLFLPLYLAIPVLLTVALLRTRLRNRRLEREGRLLAGRITQATASAEGGDFKVTIRFTALSPEGRELSGREVRVRNDLRGAPLPAEGAQVAVVYVSPKLYRVL